MDEKKTSGGNFYAPNSTISSAATSPAHESQSENSNIGFLINHTNELNQNQLDSPRSLEAHDENIDSTIIFELNQGTVAFSENSLEHESISQASQDSLEVHRYSSPKTTPYSILPVQSAEPWDQSLEDEIGSGESKRSNTIRWKTRKPSTKRKHPEETGQDVINGEANAGGNRENTGQSKQHEKFLARTSKYRGVSRGDIERYETFLWDNSDPQARPRTVYVGGFADEETAARVYDLAALKLWGVTAQINFPLSEYEKDLEEMKTMTKNEYLVKLRRKSKGFSKGVSSYRGVTRHSKLNKWQARLGKGKDTKGIYLGTFDSEEEAAKAYDVAAVRVRGMKAFTNFNIGEHDVKSILESAKIPIGKGASRVVKENSVDEILVIKKRRKPRKLPILSLKPNTLSSSRANPALQSSAEEEKIQNQLNDDDISLGVEHYFPVHDHQTPDEFKTNPSSDTNLLEKNLALIEPGENSVSELLREFEDSPHLTSTKNEKFTYQVLHEYPNSSVIKYYQNPGSSLLQAHQIDFLNLSTGDGDGNAFEITEHLSGKIERGVSSDKILECYTTLTDTNKNLGLDFLHEMQQISPCENFLQLQDQHNQDSVFDLDDSDNHQKPHQNPDLEANPNLLDGFTEIDFLENSKSIDEREISSGGIIKGNSVGVETEKNSSNGGSNERRFSSKSEGEATEEDVEDDDLNSFSCWLEAELAEKNFSTVQ